MIISDDKAESYNNESNFLLDVNTYILILELSHLDFEAKTATVWVELGFHYDVYDYLRTFDNFVRPSSSPNPKSERVKRLSCIAPEDIQIPFDIVNATTMDLRSQAHFIRNMKEAAKYEGNLNKKKSQEKTKKSFSPPETFYTEDPDLNKDGKASFLSDAKGLVSFVDLSNCPRGMYWKHETRTYRLDLNFQSTERLAPFDEIHFFFKLITANCQPGTNRIKFVYNEKESDFSGMSHSIGGYYPIKTPVKKIVASGSDTFMDDKVAVKTLEQMAVVPTINNKHSYANADIEWDRLYVSVVFRKQSVDDIIIFYVVPFLLFNFMIIRSFEGSVEALLGISSTLVIANVALLIVRQNEVFAFYEQSVLVQILVLIVSTLLLSVSEFNRDLQTILPILNLLIFITILSSHYLIARKENRSVTDHIKKGDYHLLNTI